MNGRRLATLLVTSTWLCCACEPRLVDLLGAGELSTSPSGGAASNGGATNNGDAGSNNDAGTSGESSLGGAGGGAGGSDLPAQVKPTALIVVQFRDGPIDLGIENRLLSLGFSAEQIRQDKVTLALANEYSLVVISPTADADTLGTSLGSSAIPQLILEPNIAFRLGYGVRESANATDSVSFLLPKDEIAQGLPNVLVNCTTSKTKQGAALTAGVLSIADMTTAPGVSAWYRVPKGTLIAGKSVASRRVVLSSLHEADCMTEATYELFDRSVQWLVPSD